MGELQGFSVGNGYIREIHCFSLALHRLMYTVPNLLFSMRFCRGSTVDLSSSRYTRAACEDVKLADSFEK